MSTIQGLIMHGWELIPSLGPDATVYAPCPYCFESSGYQWEHGNDWESGPWSNQTNIPCGGCDGTGLVPCDVAGPPDDRQCDFADDGYEAALDDAAAALPHVGMTGSDGRAVA